MPSIEDGGKRRRIEMDKFKERLLPSNGMPRLIKKQYNSVGCLIVENDLSQTVRSIRKLRTW